MFTTPWDWTSRLNDAERVACSRPFLKYHLWKSPTSSGRSFLHKAPESLPASIPTEVEHKSVTIFSRSLASGSFLVMWNTVRMMPLPSKIDHSSLGVCSCASGAWHSEDLTEQHPPSYSTQRVSLTLQIFRTDSSVSRKWCGSRSTASTFR